MEWIPKIEPRYQAPVHLGPLITALDEAKRKPINLVVHAPPRHSKTESCLMGIAHWLSIDPSKRHVYASYNQAIANRKSVVAREYAIQANVQLRNDSTAKEYWVTREGGGLLAAGVGGSLTGFGADGIIIIDDPFKNRAESESAAHRENIWDWFRDVVWTRREAGVSCILIMTRWHPDDLAGKLIKELGWDYVRLPALNDEGEALWPVKFPALELADIRRTVGEYTWESLYQGQPRQRGGAVFSEVSTYDELPGAMRESVGIDWAYTKKSSADWSVAVEMGVNTVVSGTIQKGYTRTDHFYVLNVTRAQVRAPQWKVTLGAIRKRRPQATFFTYIGGTEAVTIDLMAQNPGAIRIESASAQNDKFIRAQPLAAAWNEGRVHVPRDAPWLDAFLAELLSFTGVGDDHDDQVDATVAAYDALAAKSNLSRLQALGTR